MKQDASLREGIKKLAKSDDSDQVDSLRDQLTNLSLRKENLLKMIGLIETDIGAKEKELSKAK